MNQRFAGAEMSTASAGETLLEDTSKPSQNELLLSRRLLQVQQERDNLAAELARMKLQQRQQQQQDIAPKLDPEREGKLKIPAPLVPVLALLRSHITDLTRDNEALRYTFLGPASKLHTISPNLSSQPDQVLSAEELPTHRKVIGVDLEEVLKRVKALVKENDELGEMVLEAGRSRKEDWQQALDQSAQLITSLDADLEHHLGIIQSLQEKLTSYETRFGQLSRANTGNTDSTSRGEPLDISNMNEDSPTLSLLPPRLAPGGKESKTKERVVPDGLSRRGSRGGRERAFGYRGQGRGGGRRE